MNFERPDALSGPVFRDYDAAFDEITELSTDNRIIFVIDEYPYLAKAKPAVSAMLQHLIDHKWSNSKLYLILCGSSMSFIENQVLGQESPLYGRRTGQFFPDFMGLIFEKMCQDYLLYYADNLPIDLKELGQWWGTDAKKKKQVQIDIVGTSVKGKEYLIGSCKYRNEKIGIDELELLREYASVFGKGVKYHYYIFSKGGFTDALRQAAENGEVTLVCLEEMYA